MIGELEVVALPPRDPRGHKGTFGTVTVLGGCVVPTFMPGGPCLSAVAALRSGAGLAKLCLPEPLIGAALAIAPSATGIPLACAPTGELLASESARAVHAMVRAGDVSKDAVVVGPGLGTGEGAQAAVYELACCDRLACVFDADALNCLSAMPDALEAMRGSRGEAGRVLTPHVGEFRRLAVALDLEQSGDSPGAEAAAAAAQMLRGVVVLKSARTIVTDGGRVFERRGETPALATAGSGDVLAGLMGGLLAQHGLGPGAALDAFEIACLAVVVHAEAARAWSRDAQASGGMLAMELADRLPAAIERHRQAG